MTKLTAAFIGSLLGLVVADGESRGLSGAGPYNYFGDEEHIDYDWAHDTPTECSGYFQSPINIPANAVLERDAVKNSALSKSVPEDAMNVFKQYTGGEIAYQRMYNATANPNKVVQNKVDLSAAYTAYYAATTTVGSGTTTASPPFTSTTINTLTLPSGSVYQALQYHWHFPSEHQVDGDLYPGELHVVHGRISTGSTAHADEKPYLVLGFFLQHDGAGSSHLNDLAADAGGGVLRGNAATKYNLKTVFGTQMQGAYWRYKGGLTTPACNEAVEWFVFKTPFAANLAAYSVTLGAKGVAATVQANAMFQDIRTNRPVQGVHGRGVTQNTLTSENHAVNATDYNYQSATMFDVAGAYNCNVGTEQSPINFFAGNVTVGTSPANTAWLEQNAMGYTSASAGTAMACQIKNTGHGYNVIPSHIHYYMKSGNKYFPLVQFHFHFPSEHTVDGAFYDGEIHFVHGPGSTTAPSRMLEENLIDLSAHDGHLRELYGSSHGGGADHAVFGFFLKVGTVSGDSVLKKFGFDAAKGLPVAKNEVRNFNIYEKEVYETFFRRGSDSWSRNYFRYNGGLTTPPCSERVRFTIFADPLPILASEVALFKQNYESNNRPVQPHNSRKVKWNDYTESNLVMSDDASSAASRFPAVGVFSAFFTLLAMTVLMRA